MNTNNLKNFIVQHWNTSILPTLVDYIRIPNKSPLFDKDWETHGHMEKVIQLMAQWVLAQPIQGLQLRIERLPGRTPLIFIEVAGQQPGTILLYGHLDKQPEMTGWRPPLEPWKPVLEGNRLYGRGAADDGYALFAAISAIAALQEQRISHSRCLIVIEACEESGSYDLPFYLESLKKEIGTPDVVICLDSGCGNYEQLWCTTSLRGLIAGDLNVSLLTEGIHSGNGGGIVASSFRVLRQLLSRIEDETTGKILLPELNTPIPQNRCEQAALAAKTLGQHVFDEFPFQPGVKPIETDLTNLILNRTWRPSLAITGADGLPPIANAGNVLRPYTSLKLSLRTPPTCDAADASKIVQQVLEANPPYQAHVKFVPQHAANGWNAPELEPNFQKSMEEASSLFFGKPLAYMGEGGSIPFIAMLGDKFPQAQFMVTGVLGPHSNAHGPNEFLDIPTAQNVTACVAYVIGQISNYHLNI